MTTEQKLKDLILSRYKSVREFVLENDLTYSNVDSILRRGLQNATWSNVLKLCDALKISADELAEGKIVPSGETVPRNSITDVDTLLAYARRNAQEFTDLTVGGEPLSQSEVDAILDSLEIAIGLIKRNRGRNYRSEEN